MKDLRPKKNFIATQLGATLMEVLISLAVFSTGMVALANNINGSNQDLKIASFQSSAILAADDLVSRIENNPAGFADNQYNTDDTTDTMSALKSLGDSTCTEPCAGEQIATKDLKQWADAHFKVLEHAKVKIARNGEHLKIAFAVPSEITLTDCFNGITGTYCYLVEEKVCRITDNPSGAFCS